MPDVVTAKGSSESRFKNHAAGQYTAQCVDVIDLGERVVTYQGKPTELRNKIALVFRTGHVNPDTGDLIDVSMEYTLSLFETANLRQFLEAWRGKSYTVEQVDEGVPLDKLNLQWALISVEEKTSQKGRPYSIIKSISPLPAAMPHPVFPEYKRPEYWGERKLEYASESKVYRDAIGAQAASTNDFAAPPKPEVTNDDLPF